MNRRPLTQQGFTLVELMIALTLGLILTAVVGYTYMGSRQVSKQQEASSLLQQNARMAFEIMGQSIRMAGYSGCGPMLDNANNVLNPGGDWYIGFGKPVFGYDDADSSAMPTAIKSLRTRGDVLTIFNASNESHYIVESYTKSSAQFKLTNNHELKQGEILVVSDCSQSSIFQMSNVNNNNTIDVVVHNTGNAISPGNSAKDLGDYLPGAILLKAKASAYYIANNDRGEPSLYASSLQTNSGNAAAASEELIEGVQDMQVLYGVDTSATADRVIDQYVKANAVTSTAPGANDDEKWQRVLAVRISLLMVSPQGSSVTTTPQAYTFNGSTSTPSDRLLRKVMTTTIAVRNRL